MEKIIEGKIFVLGNNIDTDQIIPAEYLVFSLTDEKESAMYGKYCLSSVPLSQSGLPEGNIPFIKKDEIKSEFNIIIAGSNFGCGSSREHAPFALNKAGVKVIIAESFARIFYRNSIDGGFLIPIECKEKIYTKCITGSIAKVDLEKYQLNINDKIYELNPLGDVLPIIEAGGLFEYARKSNMI
ncbi:MAG TPA: 3-isopropylmalate dehydratase [Bacteroidota bacterium]|jgi:3-isopropylmalate/(R)-2-methylmalate dehydratase small subunit|nr:3-isopropylmalate dehydratase [Bacteroidota bacterium]